MEDSPLNNALRQFEATEANLLKSERVLSEIESEIPQGIAFISGNHEYEDNCRTFEELLEGLPALDGWKPQIVLFELDEIAQMRVDAMEIDEELCKVQVERKIQEPGRVLREYRYRFNKTRRRLVRSSIEDLIDQVDSRLRLLSKLLSDDHKPANSIENDEFDSLKEDINQIATLIGNSVDDPPRWSDLYRHLRFGQLGDLHDIIEHDWPSVKIGLRNSLYGERESIPVEVPDLGTLVDSKPKGQIASRLNWEVLLDDDFERLVFLLISGASGYENPEWLMKTNAPDRGRDLSVYRVVNDSLGGTIRSRTIIQCKHWQSRSVSPADVSMLKDQMKLWEPPRVDVHIIATSGRFTSDAVALIEKHNQADSAMRIEMWAESHLERLLASNPVLIAQFGLR